MDAAVGVRMEQGRPQEAARDAAMARNKMVVERALDLLESDVPIQHVDIGTLTLACALGYLDLRFAADAWRAATGRELAPLAGRGFGPALAFGDQRRSGIVERLGGAAVAGGGQAGRRGVAGDRVGNVDPLVGNRVVAAATSEEQRQLLDVLNAADEVGRPFIMSKQAPAERVAMIRKAFDETMTDKDYLADMDKLQLPAIPLSGEDAEKIVAEGEFTFVALDANDKPREIAAKEEENG